MILRQGDVLFIKVADEAGEMNQAKDLGSPTANGIQVAEGESSGHTHRLFGSGSKLFRFRNTARDEMFVHVGKGGATVKVIGGEVGGVPRHHPVQLGPGKYLCRVQRTWTAADEGRSERAAD